MQGQQPCPATALWDHRRQEPRAGGVGRLTRGQFLQGDPAPSPTEAGRGWAGGGREGKAGFI